MQERYSDTQTFCGNLYGRLRLQRGLTQAQLAELVGTQQPSIARLENGSSIPSLSFLHKIASALNARIEVRLVAEPQEKYRVNPPNTDA
ncbi:MAG TPA: helix-turn-helix transcriptional regulator [Anaerolineales bacterium]|nr:helix-turn-helix transcriptional regulator [Anaerolineales bacterium]